MADSIDHLIKMGYRARKEGRLQEAKEAFNEAVELSRASSVPLFLATSLAGLGQIERDLHNDRAAIQHYRESVDIHRSEPDQLRFAHTIRHLADILRKTGAVGEASYCYEEALGVYRAHAETPALDLANTIRCFALLQRDTGDSVRAKALWEEARTLYQSVNVAEGVKESEREIARWKTA